MIYKPAGFSRPGLILDYSPEQVIGRIRFDAPEQPAVQSATVTWNRVTGAIAYPATVSRAVNKQAQQQASKML